LFVSLQTNLTIKIKKEEDERKKRMKEIKEKTKEKSAEQKQLFGESDIIETDTELEESSWGQDEESEE
jgi:hypothetical protein